ncbi:hypothetical protein [Knoellia flava]|nr:hypothetical protein [Knoellia flava]
MLHTHQLPPEEERHSFGSRTVHPAAQRRGFDQLDAGTSNWCPICQSTLMRCYRAGCSNAAAEAMSYAYLAAVYALNITRGKYGRAWSSEEEDWATHVAHRRAKSRVTGNSGDPDRWPTPPSSLVNWFAGWVQRDIKTELERKFGINSDDDLDDPSTGGDHDPDPVTNPISGEGTPSGGPNPSTLRPNRSYPSNRSASGSPTYLEDQSGGIDVLGPPTGRRGQPSLMPGTTSPFRGPEQAALIKEYNELLSGELTGLVDVLLRELTGLEPRGDSPTPRELMLTYIANIVEQCRRVDGSPWKSERSIVTDRLKVLNPESKATQRDINRLQSQVRRTRTEVLTPACSALIEDRNNTLTDRQRSALQHLLHHINGDRITIATTHDEKNDTEVGPR